MAIQELREEFRRQTLDALRNRVSFSQSQPRMCDGELWRDFTFTLLGIDGNISLRERDLQLPPEQLIERIHAEVERCLVCMEEFASREAVA
jgi:hypothetical protein